MAFAVATTFWFFNSLNKDYITSLEYPVTFIYNQDSLISVRSLPSKVNLDVSGGGWNLLRKGAIFNPKPLEVALANPVEASYLSWLEMLPSIREQLRELNVIQVIQDTLRIQIEPILQKKVKIWVDSAKIKLEKDFRLVSSISYPKDSITLIGPKSFIDTIGTEFELQLLEDDIDDDFDDDVLVVVPRPHLIHSVPASVQTIFEVERFDKLQIEVPIELLNFPSDSSYYLADEIVVIQFTVQRTLQQEYVALDFGVSADFNMLRSSDSTILPMVLVFPEEVVAIEVTPKWLSVISNE